MEDTDREFRVADSETEQTEARSPETSVVTTTRLLANPRRVRRN